MISQSLFTTGNVQATVEAADGGIKGDGDFIRLTHETDPTACNWGAVGADYVAECTGVFLNTEKGEAHRQAGGKKTILSAPPKDSTPIFTLCTFQTSNFSKCDG